VADKMSTDEIALWIACASAMMAEAGTGSLQSRAATAATAADSLVAEFRKRVPPPDRP
jgi:hypothetical protein